MPNDLQDWINTTGGTLRPPFVGTFVSQAAATEAGGPYSLITLSYQLVFTLGNLLFTATSRTAGSAGIIAAILVNTIHPATLLLVAGMVAPAAPLTVSWPQPFDIAASLANLGALPGDAIDLRLAVSDVLNVSTIDAALSFQYSQE